MDSFTKKGGRHHASHILRIQMIFLGYFLLLIGQLCLSLAKESSSNKFSTGGAPSSWWRTQENGSVSNMHTQRNGTRTTGAGSRSIRNRSIFVDRNPRQIESSVENNMNRRMFAKLNDDGNILLRFLDSFSSNSKDVIYKLSNIVAGDPRRNQTSIQIQQWHPDSTTTSSDAWNPSWLPIQGIYGFFLLPSGWHLALITESELIYNTSPVLDTKDDSNTPLLNIRRIQSMEIVPLSPSTTNLSIAERKAEERQLRLLRRAFREHDLYFVPLSSSKDEDDIVTDITNTLQRSFLLWTNRQRQSIQHDEILLQYRGVPHACYYNFSHHSINYTLLSTVGPTDNEPVSAGLKIRAFARMIAISQPIHLHSILLNPLDALVTANTFLPLYNHSFSHTSIANDSPVDSSTWGATLDSRFFWNEKNLQVLQSSKCPESQELLPFCIPVTSAFVGVQRDVSVHSNSSTADVIIYDEILISRRSKFRSGTRFTRRGADGTGAVANFAETEQICIIRGESKGETPRNPTTTTKSPTIHSEREYILEIYSHVQTRGSIPLRWSSPADVKTYRPRVLIGTDPLSQARALRNHLFEQLQTYCISHHDSTLSLRSSLYNNSSGIKLVFVNLIDKKSDQGRLGRAFDSVLSAVIDVYSEYFQTLADDTSSAPITSVSRFVSPHAVQHIWFDFHENVKHGKWSKLGALLNQLSMILDQQGYFCATQRFDKGHDRWVIKSLQDGVIRTNCMDCLDRTNVVQSIFGRYILFRQLQERKGKHSARQNTRKITRNLPVSATAAFQRQNLKLPWVQGEDAHRLLWADNADIISRLYAGTNALKGDFTRTGIRTKQGIFDDGVNSLQRYYLNNFHDAQRQEAIDLIVGNADFAFTMGDENSIHMNDDTKYARIKITKASQTDIIPRINLRLQWLPGDLQSQMRSYSVVGSPFIEDIVSQQLNDIDRRSTSDQPWWVVDNQEHKIKQ